MSRPPLPLVLALAWGVAGCGALPGPTAAPTLPPRSPASTGEPAPGGSARVVVRLSGREIVLAGGSCTWHEGASHLIVEAGGTAGGDWLRLTAPLSWLGQELPPGAGSTEAALQARIGGMEVDAPAAALSGAVSADLGRGNFDAGLVAGGMPLSGDFRCPEVLEDD